MIKNGSLVYKEKIEYPEIKNREGDIIYKAVNVVITGTQEKIENHRKSIERKRNNFIKSLK